VGRRGTGDPKNWGNWILNQKKGLVAERVAQGRGSFLKAESEGTEEAGSSAAAVSGAGSEDGGGELYSRATDG